MIAFPDLPDAVLAPLAGRSNEDWFRAPPGKWCAGQIVHHLAIALDNSGMGFASRVDKPPMQRRPRTPYQVLGCILILDIGWFPPGLKAPPTALPHTRPDRAATERLLREAVARFVTLERQLLPSRARDLFVKHPVLGDLTLREWQRFHVRHAAHHLRQVVERIG